MSIEKSNEIGTIKVNKNVIGTVVEKALLLTEGKVWPANEKAKLITNITGGWPFLSEICDNLYIKEKNGELYIKINVIVSFGTSIKKNTDMILDHIEENLKTMFTGTPCKMCIYICGVKSKYIAPRDLEVLREWN